MIWIFLVTLVIRKITGFRNVHKVKSNEHFAGYTFIFEAEGEWIKYVPMVEQFKTVTRFHFPLQDCDGNYTPGPIQIRFYRLDELFGQLPIEE